MVLFFKYIRVLSIFRKTVLDFDESEILGRKNRFNKENLVETCVTGTVWGTGQPGSGAWKCWEKAAVWPAAAALQRSNRTRLNY